MTIMNTPTNTEASPLTTCSPWPRAKWWQWLIYKLFRWAWNPILRDNPAYRAAVMDSLLFYNLERRRYSSVDSMLRTMTPRFYVEYWRNPSKGNANVEASPPLPDTTMPNEKTKSKPETAAKQKAGGDCPSAPCSPSFLFCDGCGKVHEETDNFLMCECGRIAMRMEWATPAQIAVERGHPCQRCEYCGFIEDSDGNLAGECPECLGRAAKIHRENSKAQEGESLS